jgi:Uma2 family endonuclease
MEGGLETIGRNIFEEKIMRLCFTWHDAHLLPEDQSYEILDGNLLAVPSPNIVHRHVIRNLEAALRRQISQMDWGEVFHSPPGVVLSKTTLVLPDIFLLRKTRMGIIQGGKALGAPDLIIEIATANGRVADLTAKRRLYAQHGIPEYWIVSPSARRVEVLIWSEVGYVRAKPRVATECILSPLLPMLRIPLGEIF